MLDSNLNSISIDNILLNTILPNLSDYQALFEGIIWYTLAVRFLMYAMIIIQSDIAFALSIVSRYCKNLDFIYIAIVSQILQYIKDSLDISITF